MDCSTISDFEGRIAILAICNSEGSIVDVKVVSNDLLTLKSFNISCDSSEVTSVLIESSLNGRKAVFDFFDLSLVCLDVSIESVNLAI